MSLNEGPTGTLRGETQRAQDIDFTVQTWMYRWKLEFQMQQRLDVLFTLHTVVRAGVLIRVLYRDTGMFY